MAAIIEIHVHNHVDVSEIIQRLTDLQVDTNVLRKQGTNIMATAAQVKQDIADTKVLVKQLIDLVQSNDQAQADLRAQLAEKVAALNLTQAERDALQKDIDGLFDDAEDLENTTRAGIPGVPPVGGTPLLPSYAALADFQAAVAAYTGPEAVSLDGTEVKAGTTPGLGYFTQADNSISTSAP